MIIPHALQAVFETSGTSHPAQLEQQLQIVLVHGLLSDHHQQARVSCLHSPPRLLLKQLAARMTTWEAGADDVCCANVSGGRESATRSHGENDATSVDDDENEKNAACGVRALCCDDEAEAEARQR